MIDDRGWDRSGETTTTTPTPTRWGYMKCAGVEPGGSRRNGKCAREKMTKDDVRDCSRRADMGAECPWGVRGRSV